MRQKTKGIIIVGLLLAAIFIHYGGQARAGIDTVWYLSSTFWITLLIVIIIGLIYGIWEKGPKRGFFRK